MIVFEIFKKFFSRSKQFFQRFKIKESTVIKNVALGGVFQIEKSLTILWSHFDGRFVVKTCFTNMKAD